MNMAGPGEPGPGPVPGPGGPGPGPGPQDPLEVVRDLQQILELPRLVEELEELDMMQVNLPAGFRGRIGLNETSLTRALGKGDYSLAEKIIEETTDPEFLNDGALSATPLNMVLTGRSSFFHQSRNLKLAMLLLQRGANPNLRIPNHDMESASESPLELLLRYYLKLTDVFGVPGTGFCRTSFRPNSFEETELMDTVGLNGELGGLGPGQVTSQARQLLVFCLENGGDTNLPTTDAAKTIFHMTLLAQSPDRTLLRRMLEMGANVNLADVHNTTPLMDIIQLGDEVRAQSDLAELQSQGRAVLLDSQNCSLQSALWRATFQGHLRLALGLLEAGASQVCSARVEPVLGRSDRLMPRHPHIKTASPALLAPFLNDSPCTANMNVRLPKRRHSRVKHSYSALAALHVSRTQVAPLLDLGCMQANAVVEQVTTMVCLHTDHKLAGDSSKVDSVAVLPLMFGELSAGLRQLAVRSILRQTLFNGSVERTLNLLDTVCRNNEGGGFTVSQLLVPPSQTSLLRREQGEQVMTHEYEIELGSEMELSFRYDDQLEENKSDSAELAIQDVFVSENRPSGGEELIVSDDDLGAESSVVGKENKLEETMNDEQVLDIFNTIDKLDREFEVIRTDSALLTLDRDLASWEVELQGTLDRINTYQQELGSLLSPVRVGQVRQAVEEEGVELNIEDARRRSEQLLEELLVQKEVLLNTNKDIREIEIELGEVKYDTAMVQSNTITGLRGDRRVLDENWSLGSHLGFNSEDNISGHKGAVLQGFSLSDSLSPVCQLCHSVHINEGCSVLQPVLDHTEHLVPSLDISVTLPTSTQDQQVPPCQERQKVPGLTSSDCESDSSNPSQEPRYHSTVSNTSPRTMANNLAILNNRLFHQMSQGVSGYFRNPPRNFRSPAAPPVGPTTPSSPVRLPVLLDSSNDEESDSSSDSDTWGGTFSLRHTRRQADQSDTSPVGDSTIVSRLTTRTLNALTDRLRIPAGLRPCFALEAARLQLTLALFNHQSIGCDRNCEGDDSDSDSEEDWLATETEESDETEEENRIPSALSDNQPSLTSSTSSESSSVSDFSQRSWFGSPTEETGGLPLSPRSNFFVPLSSSPQNSSRSSSRVSPRREAEDVSWLEDRQDLRRMREFLSSPGPEFNHSTDSDSESTSSHLG